MHAPHRFSPTELAESRSAVRGMAQPRRYEVDSELPLPRALQRLLELHTAIEHGLLVHMATSGAPAAEPLTTTPRRRVVIPNVISYSRLKPIVERTCQRKLDVPDFRRLVWLWSHAPGSEVDSRFTDEVAVERQGGMGFFVTKVRTFDLRTQRRIYDWGIGIEMSLSRSLRRPTTPPLQVQYGSPKNRAASKSVVPPSSPRSDAPHTPPRSPTVRDDMSYLAVWNMGVEERRAEFRRRLHMLVAAHHDAWLAERGLSLASCVLPPASTTQTHAALMEAVSAAPRTPKALRIPSGYDLGDAGLLTPRATRTPEGHAPRVAHDINALSPPASPLASHSRKRALLGAAEPLLDGTHEQDVQTPFDTDCTSSSTSNQTTISPRPSTPKQTRVAQRLYRWHPNFPLEALPEVPLAALPPLATAPVAPTAAATTRAVLSARGAPSAQPKAPGTTLEERIRAKEQALRAPRPVNGASLHERSVLSRLSEIADAIYLLYTTSNVPATQAGPGQHTTVLPMTEVLSALEKSARVAMSRTESHRAVHMLMDTAPGWLTKSRVGTQDWLRMDNNPAAGHGLRDVRAKIHQAIAATRPVM